jgi:hypothetical protein
MLAEKYFIYEYALVEKDLLSLEFLAKTLDIK